MSKRTREPVVQAPAANHIVLTLIAEAEMGDLVFGIVEAALSSRYHEIQKGVWNLRYVSKFWATHVQHAFACLFPSSPLFARLDTQFKEIQDAYREWNLGPLGTQPTCFPWWKTSSHYLPSDSPLHTFRPLFVAWTQWHFPLPISKKEQEELKALLVPFLDPSWALQGLLGTGFAPELNMEQRHVYYAMARIMQIDSVCLANAFLPILCVMDHNESMPFLLLYLASCSMQCKRITEESSRHDLEMEVADTIYINKRRNRKRHRVTDAHYFNVLMPVECLH